jgi:hypothetical protein
VLENGAESGLFFHFLKSGLPVLDIACSMVFHLTCKGPRGRAGANHYGFTRYPEMVASAVALPLISVRVTMSVGGESV